MELLKYSAYRNVTTMVVKAELAQSYEAQAAMRRFWPDLRLSGAVCVPVEEPVDSVTGLPGWMERVEATTR